MPWAAPRHPLRARSNSRGPKVPGILTFATLRVRAGENQAREPFGPADPVFLVAIGGSVSPPAAISANRASALLMNIDVPLLPQSAGATSWSPRCTR